jgi:hypothetical protein
VKKSKKKRARSVQKAAAPAPAFITKSAARYAAKTAGMVACGKGHWNRPGGNLCSECLELMPGVRVPPMEWIGKSAFATRFWARQLKNSPASADREQFNKMLYGQNGGAA